MQTSLSGVSLQRAPVTADRLFVGCLGSTSYLEPARRPWNGGSFRTAMGRRPVDRAGLFVGGSFLKESRGPGDPRRLLPAHLLLAAAEWGPSSSGVSRGLLALFAGCFPSSSGCRPQPRATGTACLLRLLLRGPGVPLNPEGSLPETPPLHPPASPTPTSPCLASPPLMRCRHNR